MWRKAEVEWQTMRIILKVTSDAPGAGGPVSLEIAVMHASLCRAIVDQGGLGRHVYRHD